MSRWFYKGTHPTSITVDGTELPIAPKTHVEAPRSAIRVPALFVLVEDAEPVAVAPEVSVEPATFSAEPEHRPVAEVIPSPAASDVVSSSKSPDDTHSGSDEDQQTQAEEPPATEYKTRRNRQR